VSSAFLSLTSTAFIRSCCLGKQKKSGFALISFTAVQRQLRSNGEVLRVVTIGDFIEIDNIGDDFFLSISLSTIFIKIVIELNDEKIIGTCTFLIT
jgi:hypothetical protein